jgi:predicted nuclease of restriction endonuclease-like (RecB) superfamily
MGVAYQNHAQSFHSKIIYKFFKSNIMNTNKEYAQFITELKQNIIQSQYVAVSVANQQKLSLYFRTGKMLSEKITSQKWGSKVVEQIAEDLQKQLPGLKGFSRRNLLYMRQFHLTYQDFLIVQSPTAQMQINENQPHAIWQSATAKLENPELKAFFGISFTHHILLLNKCKDMEERLFYILHAATQFWSVSVLEHNINAGLFEKQGKLPNNFTYTLPKEISSSAREVFKDEYLMDYMDLDENADERKVESEIVANELIFYDSSPGSALFSLISIRPSTERRPADKFNLKRLGITNNKRGFCRIHIPVLS